MGGLLMRLARPFFHRQVASVSRAPSAEPATFNGFPVCVLTTVGARSGQERKHVLGAFPVGENAWLIVASKGGAATHSDWFHNIAKNPDKVRSRSEIAASTPMSSRCGERSVRMVGLAVRDNRQNQKLLAVVGRPAPGEAHYHLPRH
jgi:deazaflavin-dependent oxidoreductase (nitroreductase family)